MADIFREIDEEMRRDRATQVWRDYAPYIIGLAVAVLLVTAGIVGWREWRLSQARAQGIELAQAVKLAQTGKNEEALTALDRLAREGDGGYGLLARLRAAGIQAKAGDTVGAAATYETIAANADAPPLYRDLAVLLLALNRVDQGDPAELLPRVEPLTAEGNPWRYSARELTAMLERKRGNDARAREIYKSLSEASDTPAGLKARAGEMLLVLGKDAG